MSHDESFVNQVIASAATGGGRLDKSGTGGERGELWVMSQRRLKRWDGSFRDYKKAIRHLVETGVDHNSL